MTTNITITVPTGTSNHGDPEIICLPSKWTDILLFYAVNYLAHAVTVKSYPGEKLQDTAYYIVMALLYPYSGLLRGMEAINRRAAWCRGNELQRAARAGALCVVVRDADWKPLDGQIVTGCLIRRREVAVDRESQGEEEGVMTEEGDTIQLTTASWLTFIPRNFYEGIFRNPVIGTERTIHGSRYLPPGYTIAFLPSNVEFEGRPADGAFSADVSISSSYNFVKALVAIVQVVLASTTLYKTRGDQIERYGYAAFGLTVLPYVIMSTVNLLGNLLTPDFPTLYLVRSPEMNEAEDPKRNGWFDGVIGEVKHASREDDGIDILFKEVEGGGFELHTAETHPSVGLVEDGPSLVGDVLHPADFHCSQQEPTASTIKQRKLILEKVCVISGEGHTTLPPYDPFEDVEDRGIRMAHLRSHADQTSKPTLNLNIPAASNFVYSKAQAWGEYRSSIWIWIAVFMIFVPLAIVGVLTKFKSGNSTSPRRTWIMGWLVFGTFGGVVFAATSLNVTWDKSFNQKTVDTQSLPIFDIMKFLTPQRNDRAHQWLQKCPPWLSKYVERALTGRRNFQDWVRSDDSKPLVNRWMERLALMIIYAAFAIGGLVVVGQMLTEYGTCSKLS